ncbi:MAG: hypothetical protein HYT87_05655 [Nitrospirae bacterium]|nr:hypothetical protein [Nitrospirota bacterium]
MEGGDPDRNPVPTRRSTSTRPNSSTREAGREIAELIGIALEGISQLLDSHGWNSTEAMALRTLTKILENAKRRAEELGTS